MILIYHTKMKSNLAPIGLLPRTPKGCEHPRLRTPGLKNNKILFNIIVLDKFKSK